MNRFVRALWVFFSRASRRALGKPTGYFRIGKCRRCGSCCKDVVLNIEGRKLKSLDEFQGLIEEDPRYGNFVLKGENPDGVLFFYCTKLDEETNLCTIYEDRPTICVEFPDPDILKCGGDVVSGCGFYLVPPLDFHTLMQKEGGNDI